jgi:hypothetical protein
MARIAKSALRVINRLEHYAKMNVGGQKLGASYGK